MTVDERFWSRVEKTDFCWTWKGSKRRQGYGLFSVTGRRFKAGEVVQAHRYAWISANGPIPDGLFVLHHCDNPPCVRPSHLYLGTQKDNGRDASERRRFPRQHQTSCINGHLFTSDNTILDKNGNRHCRECQRKANLASYHKRKERENGRR